MYINRYLKYNFALTCIVFFYIVPTSVAQSIQNLSLSSGLQSFGGIDLGYSPLRYSGVRSIISMNYEQEATTRTASLSVNFAQGTNRSSGGNSMDTYSINIISQIFYHSESSYDKKLLFGWSIQNEYNQRVHQSFSNFNNRMDYFTSLGPAIGYLFPILRETKKLHWKTTAHLHGLGFKVASDYISSEPRVAELGGVVGKGPWHAPDIFLIGRDWSMGCWSEIRYESNVGNSLAIQHQFEFQQLSVAQNLMRVRNSLMFNVCVRL